MKKLLIATMAAVSVGLCVKAEDTGFISGTSFEDIEAGSELPKDIGNFKWPSEADDALFVVSNLTAFVNEEKGSRPDYWATADDSVALTIDTSTPLCCDVCSNNTAYELSEGDLFFDSVVQFTATDVIAEPDSRDKLRVWLYTSSDDVSTETPGSFGETSPKTCLVVTAGYLKDGATPSVTNYLANIDVAPDTWHRLTIKSFKDGGYVKYNVWVDGTQISVDGVNDFMSLIPDTETTGYYSVQCVAFDGKGAVDDIVFTTTAPEFAREPEAPTVETYTLSIVGENFEYEVYTDEAWSDKVTDLTAINTEYKTLWLGITPTGNYELESIKLGDKTITLPEYDEVEKLYYLDELQISTEDIDNGATFTLTITMKEKAGGGSGGVTVDGTPVEFDNDGMIANITTAFDGKAVSGELDTTKFKSYYTAKVENGILSIKLDQKAAAPFAEATEEKEVLEVGEDASGNPVLTVRIKPYVGLYYGAMTGSALDNLTLTSDYQKATTADVIEFTATGEAGDTAGFIKVVVTDIAPEE